jgi:glutamate transport system ATP-binding protein
MDTLPELDVTGGGDVNLGTFDSGKTWIDGKPLPQEGKGLARLRADVGMVFRPFHLLAHKTLL